MTKPQVFTIGYEGADVDRFLTTLKDAGVGALADVRAVALSRKRGFSKSALRDALTNQGIGYQHFIKLGTPKEGRQAARAGDGELMRRIYCNEVLATEPAQEAFRELEALAQANRSAFSASSVIPPIATAACWRSASPKEASRRWI
jgi:uncharacterized protein (DUF488 family)